MKRMILGALALTLALSAFAQETPRRWAVVDFSANLMREEPDYAAENGDQALMGTVVEIIGEKSYWRQIISPEPYKAWVTAMGLVEMDEAALDAYLEAPKYICTAEVTHIFSEPSVKSERVSEFLMGNIVRKCLSDKGKPIKTKGFVKVMMPSGREGYVQACEVEDFAQWAQTRTVDAEHLFDVAWKFLGVPYMWGGTSIKNVDCSGFARSSYFMLGVLLPRNASQQVKVGGEVTPDMEHLQPGDLVFFGKEATAEKPLKIRHVGIYIGDGRYIHSSQVVRISSLDPSSPDYAETPIRARRIIGHVDDGTGVTSMLESPLYFKQKQVYLQR